MIPINSGCGISLGSSGSRGLRKVYLQLGNNCGWAIGSVDGDGLPQHTITALDVGVGLPGGSLGGDGGIINDDVTQPNKQRRMRLCEGKRCASRIRQRCNNGGEWERKRQNAGIVVILEPSELVDEKTRCEWIFYGPNITTRFAGETLK